MKRLALGFALVLTAGLLWGGLALAASTRPSSTYNNTLEGTQVMPGMRGGNLILAGKASGDLAGSYHFMVHSDPVTKSVRGGRWTLAVRQEKADGTSSQGALNGEISGGTVVTDNDGAVISVNGVQLTIKDGSGAYAGVAGGGGEMSGTISAENKTSFSGTLSLTF